MEKRKYDSTVARIAGNIAAGIVATPLCTRSDDRTVARLVVAIAREIVAEVERTEPASAPTEKP